MMKKQQFWQTLIIFVTLLLSIIVVREISSNYLLKTGIVSYQSHMVLGIVANFGLILISYFFIKKNDLLKIAGIKGTKLTKWKLLLFPFIYLGALNLLTMDEVDIGILLPNIIYLIVYVVSIGFAEELAIRGFLQSHIINYFGKSKRNIILSIFTASIFFGVIHLIKFDKGLYGELSQILFATFIGLVFGSLLVITKRMYPLIIIHSVVNFIANVDSAGLLIKEKLSNPTSIDNSILLVFLVSPCLLYALYLMKKHPLK